MFDTQNAIETYVTANYPGSTVLVTDYHVVITVRGTDVEVRANWQRPSPTKSAMWEVQVSGSSFRLAPHAMLDEVALFMDAARIGVWLQDLLAK